MSFFKKNSKGLPHPVFFLLAILLVLAPLQADAASKKRKSRPQADRYASIVIEADTGYVLSERYADKKLYPASLTKMMTLYLAFEALDSGKLTKNTRLPVSKHAAFQEPSELGLAAGSTIRVNDAILGLVTKSANDAAVVLAEGLAGSETRFAESMTRKARLLGMNNTTFRNASGLHHPLQISSARDMAVLGQALLRDFPRHYKYFSTTNFSYAGKNYHNHNGLLKTYDGIDGIKTGYIHASGFNLVASAKRNGTRLIGVVFGGRTSKSRNDHMTVLLNAGFEKVNDVRVAGLIAKRQAAPAIGKPVSVAAALPAPRPRFDALGLVTEQGDAAVQAPAAISSASAVSSMAEKTTQKFLRDFQPRPLNTTTINAKSATEGTEMASALPKSALKGEWTIQVGAFSSHATSLAAAKAAQAQLPTHIALGSEYAVVPLMTNRGVIYRARLNGLGRSEANEACRLLQGHCLILTSQ